jgi:predicted NUDIX family phosphoesterase
VTEELVLVLPREVALGGPGWHGVRAAGVTELLASAGSRGEFRPRSEVESDPSLKQVIPYLVLRDGPAYFLMRRTRAGGDARLHDLGTIGIGGHLNPDDRDVAGGLHREWAEEIVADFVPAFVPVGLLNDDSNPVGSVHIGVVCVADAAGRSVAIRETDKLAGAFAPPAEVRRVRDELETWSRLVFDFLEAAGGDGTGAA